MMRPASLGVENEIWSAQKMPVYITIDPSQKGHSEWQTT